MSPITDAGLASQLRLTTARLSRRVRQESAIAGETLSASCMAALASVERLGPITLGELAAVEQVQPPSMTRIVARIEEFGYATRVTDVDDRRVARVEITERGRRVLARHRTRKDAFLAKRVARLTESERAVLAAALPLLERLQEEA
ncbi:MAG: MarR family winged helix-turn-helix transcriptional regulator [Acidimicrobiia bacterium]